MEQAKMFETEDLPLFSGTAPMGHIETFDPKPEHRQESLAKCRLCQDTGVLGEHAFCWCEAGQKAKAERGANARSQPPITMRKGVRYDTQRRETTGHSVS